MVLLLVLTCVSGEGEGPPGRRMLGGIGAVPVGRSAAVGAVDDVDTGPGAGVDGGGEHGFAEVEAEQRDDDDDPEADAEELDRAPGDDAQDQDEWQRDVYGRDLLSADGAAVSSGGQLSGGAGCVVGGESAAGSRTGCGVSFAAPVVVRGADVHGSDTG